MAREPLTAGHRPSLTDLAYEAIAGSIVDGDAAPGSRLLIDRLAAELDMSITPVREALSRLATERLVRQDNNRGYTVSAMLDQAEFSDLCHVRGLLETDAVRGRGFQRHAIDRLAGLSDAMSRDLEGASYQGFRQFNSADREFHLTLVRLSHNKFLVNAWRDLHFHLHVARAYAGRGIVDAKEGIDEHAGIVRALRQDPDEAVAAVQAHVDGAHRRLRALFPDPQGPDR